MYRPYIRYALFFWFVFPFLIFSSPLISYYIFLSVTLSLSLSLSLSKSSSWCGGGGGGNNHWLIIFFVLLIRKCIAKHPIHQTALFSCLPLLSETHVSTTRLHLKTGNLYSKNDTSLLIYFLSTLDILKWLCIMGVTMMLIVCQWYW